MEDEGLLKRLGQSGVPQSPPPPPASVRLVFHQEIRNGGKGVERHKHF